MGGGFFRKPGKAAAAFATKTTVAIACGQDPVTAAIGVAIVGEIGHHVK